MEWISVKDKLPEVGLQVIVFDEHEGILMATYETKILERHAAITVKVGDECNDWDNYPWCHWCQPDFANVTHWAYLPLCPDGSKWEPEDWDVTELQEDLKKKWAALLEGPKE